MNTYVSERATGSTAAPETMPTRMRHASPPLGITAVVFTVLKLASIGAVSNLASVPAFPGPLQSATEIVAYFQRYPSAVLLCACLQVGSAVPLGIVTAPAVSRLRFPGVTAAGAYIGSFGGLAVASLEPATSRERRTSWNTTETGSPDGLALPTC